jgi:hypothetical protein
VVGELGLDAGVRRSHGIVDVVRGIVAVRLDKLLQPGPEAVRVLVIVRAAVVMRVSMIVLRGLGRGGHPFEADRVG